jgi:hypothetical protein
MKRRRFVPVVGALEPRLTLDGSGTPMPPVDPILLPTGPGPLYPDWEWPGTVAGGDWTDPPAPPPTPR